MCWKRCWELLPAGTGLERGRRRGSPAGKEGMSWERSCSQGGEQGAELRWQSWMQRPRRRKEIIPREKVAEAERDTERNTVSEGEGGFNF